MPSPNKRLLVFNLATDADHPLLGFTTLWIRELARHVEFIHVITMQAGRLDLPKNVHVHSVGKEYGYSEPRRVLEFYRILLGILRRERIDGCFSHMMQIFSVLAGPVLRAKGIPLITWYAHPQLSPSLKLGHFFSNRMVTSLPGAYPWRKNKLSVIGQGIDTARFTPAQLPAADDDLILCAGRISRVKNHPTLLRAVARLPRRVPVVILGATAGAEDKTYAAELRQLVVELGIAEIVTFAKPVPSAELPQHYRRCALHVNLTPVGFGDKVAWEAMACGRPCLVANQDFRETLGRYADELLFRVNDPADLAAKLSAVLQKSAAERAEIGAYLRSQVERLHSLPRLAENILGELSKLRTNGESSMKISSHQFHSPLRVAFQLAKGKSLYRALFNLALSRYEVSGRILDLGAKDKRGSYWEFLGKSGEVDVVHTDLAEAPGVVALDVEQRFPLPSASFDAVLAFNLFEHVRNHSLAASEVFRILRPGGTFLIATPFLHEYHGDPDDFFRFTDSYLKHWWEASGFRCVSIHALGEGVFTWLGCKLPSLFFPAAHRPLATALFYLAATGLDRLAVYRPRVSARTLPERFACGYFGVFQRPASFHESVSSRDHRALQCCE